MYRVSPVLVLVVDDDVYQVEEVEWNSTDQAEQEWRNYIQLHF